MNCVLCFIGRGVEQPAPYVLSGLTLCDECVRRVASGIANDVAVRHVVGQALKGRW